ncbi:DUF3549 domain-containing protein [Marinobacter salinus]|uniref:DUF3549 domain-containing protein n=1 Tax=Marinobacter salinus TaxID=1874317 RepID=A0A1D9GLF8_9GAMM|nr:DUF6279 family lipoprotein [Marinobacter salinus]AOY88472.1 DUF3549 domain-containing protein [Marinobacter salinus]
MNVLGNSRITKRGAIVLLLISAALLSACSSTKMAYRYADWGIVWWVEDYVTLTGAQKQQLNTDIDQLRQWHCSTELPRYQVWLTGLESDIRQGNLDQAALAYHQDQLFDFFDPLLTRVPPIAANLLASLSDPQVRELAENMEQNQEELENKFLADDPDATATARAERTQERVERWLGDLNANQKAIVNTWSSQRGRQTEIWLEGRRNWQLALLDTLQRRDEAGFSGEVERLITESERFRGEEYQAMMAESQSAINTLIRDLVQASDSVHLTHLSGRAAELNDDFESLACSSAPEVAASPDDQMVR